MCVLKEGDKGSLTNTHLLEVIIMLKEKFSVSVKVGKRIASDATRIAKTGSVKAVNTTVKATKVSTKFVADKANKIPEINLADNNTEEA